MKKRLLALLLALVLVLGAMPFTALADGASIVAQGTCGDQGDNVTWVLTDDGVLTISGTGAMADYTSKARPGYDAYYDQVISVVVSEGVTAIGNYAFCGRSAVYTSLTSVSFPSTLNKIGNFAFRYTKLTSVSVPNAITEFGRSAFMNIDTMKSATVGAESIPSGAFSNCTSLETLVFEKGVKSIEENAFENCASLKELVFPEGFISVGNSVFSMCTALEKVSFPSSCTNIGMSCFWNCSSLKNVTLPAGLTTLGDSAFKGTAITSIEIPAGVKTIEGNTFQNCGALASVKLNEGLEIIKTDAFADCISLTSINLPSTLTTIEDYRAFQNCLELTEITLPKNLTYLGHSAFSGCSGLKTVTMYDKLATVSYQAFKGCTALETVNFHGTEEQWQAIEIRSDNDPLLAANVNFIDFADEKPVVKAENDKASGKVKLTITPVEGAVKYKIYVAEKAEGPFTLVKETTELTYTHNGKAGTKYFFKVVAVNEDGKESAESAVVNKVQLPGQVKSLKAKSTKKKEVTLTWKKVTGAKKYFIYMSKNGKTGWKKIGTATKTKFVYKKGTPGKKLYFRVQAVTANGKKGEFSKVVSVKVKK